MVHGVGDGSAYAQHPDFTDAFDADGAGDIVFLLQRNRLAANWLRGGFLFNPNQPYSSLSIVTGKSRTRLPVAW